MSAFHEYARKQADRMRRLRSDLTDPGSGNFCTETDISRSEGKEIDRWIADRQSDEKETKDRSCKIMGDVGTSDGSTLQ
jgi:hypothetical protein